jgi:hypothetical protein
MYIVLFDDGSVAQSDNKLPDIERSVLAGGAVRLFNIPPSNDLASEFHADGEWHVLTILP